MLGLINKLRRYRWGLIGRNQIKKLVRLKHQQGQAIKIILGSSDHNALNGEWINTDIPQFDITNENHWAYIFGDIKIDNLLAEHVMEHLTEEQNRKVIHLIHLYLNQKAVFRFAVPDGNHPDQSYIKYVKPNGNGPGCDDHKMLWTIEIANNLFDPNKFTIQPLEFYDKLGKLNTFPFDNNNGFINRTFSNPNKADWQFKNYTSLIIDLTKK